MQNVLAHNRLPFHELDFIKSLNKRQPVLPATRLLDERKVLLYGKVLESPQVRKFFGRDLYMEEHDMRGVPQGSPLSPILSILMLEQCLMKHPNIVMYADDGIVFDKSLNLDPKADKAMDDLCIQLNKKKSKLVKENGKWLHPLKFLGIELYEEGTRLRSKTRKGTIKEFDNEISFLEHLRKRQLQLMGSAQNSEMKLPFESFVEGEYNKHLENIKNQS